MATVLETPSVLDTPWTSAGASPALPVRADGPTAAVAAPVGAVTSAATIELVTPWAAADVHLPARATSLPWLATGRLLGLITPV